MNSESLGHYLFGQQKQGRRSKVAAVEMRSANTITSGGEVQCAKGICEVAWKPAQQDLKATAEQIQTDLLSCTDNLV